MPVDLDIGGILANFRRTGSGSAFLAGFTSAAGDPSSVLEAVGEAAGRASMAIERADPELRAAAQSPALAPTAVLVLVDPCDTEDALRRWCQVFCEGLDEAGLTGRVAAVAEEWPAANLEDPPARVVAAGVAFPVDIATLVDERRRGIRRSRWQLDETSTRSIVADALVEFPDTCEVLVRDGAISYRVSLESARGLVDSALGRDRAASVVHETEHRHYTEVDFDVYGHLMLRRRQSDGGWDLALDEAEAFAARFTDRAEYAAVRPGGAMDLGWGSFVNAYEPRVSGRLIAGYAFSYRDLEASYVPDAYPVQYLTDAHVSKAHDLSGWDVSRVGRLHRVAHPDAAAWFEGESPDPDVVARARADFGDMLLTDEIGRSESAVFRAGAEWRRSRTNRS